MRRKRIDWAQFLSLPALILFSIFFVYPYCSAVHTYEKNSCGKYPLGNDSGLLHTGNAVCGVHLRNIYKSAAKRIGRSGCVRWLHRVQRFLESYFPDYKTRNGILRDSERLWYLEQLCAGYVLLAVEGKAEYPAGIVRLFPAVWRW